jgi:putative two-component system response regulator
VPRVLCVDDDQFIRSMMERAFRFGGYDVTVAAGGAEAIRLLDGDDGFDLLVTDHSMPGVTGIDVIEHALRTDPALTAIIVTAYHDLDIAMRALQAGAVGFIPKPFNPDHLLTVAGRALERRQLAADALRLGLLVPMLERFTMLLANTLESKDCASTRHSERLVANAEAVARQLGLDDDARFSVRVGACLHDIGKVGVPEELLRKSGPLTEEERDVIRLHPDIGAAILDDIDTWDDVRLIVRHHHERWDGSGYPLGLCSTDIPVGARIVSVVDAFDVMTMGRSYAPARPAERALDEIIAARGRQFDPDVVDALRAVLVSPGDYHDVVDTISELHLIARRARTTALPRSMAVEGAR